MTHILFDADLFFDSNKIALLLMKEKTLKVSVADIATIYSGHPFRGKIPEKSGGGIHVVQMKNISVDNHINWDSIIETEFTGKKQPDWLIKGDVLFAARGARNYAALIDRDIEQLVSSPHFYILKINNQAVLPEFLVWQLNQKQLQNYFDRSSEGTLTKSVRRSVLENAEIHIPPIEKQTQILGLHKTLLQEKRLYTELIENADKLMNSIAREVITGHCYNERENK